MGFSLNKTLACTYDEALARIPDALKAEGFGVLTEIDVQQTLKNKLGVDFRRYKILGACNPSIAHEALTTALEIGVMLPCNVVVYEGDDGRAVVQAIDPTQTLATDARFAKNAGIVREKLARVLAGLQ